MKYLVIFVHAIVIPALSAQLSGGYGGFGHGHLQQGDFSHGFQGNFGNLQQYDQGGNGHDYSGVGLEHGSHSSSQLVDQTYEITKPVQIPVYKHEKVPIPYAFPVPVPKPVVIPVAQPYAVRILVPHAVPVPVLKTINVPIEKQIPEPIIKEVPFHYDKPVPVHVDVPKKYPVYVPVYKHIYVPSKGKQESQIMQVVKKSH